MIIYKKIQESKIAEIPVSITCDVCKKEYLYNTNDVSDVEIGEFHCMRLIGGYGSVFGDGIEIECDICQHCLKLLIGNYCRKVNIND